MESMLLLEVDCVAEEFCHLDSFGNLQVPANPGDRECTREEAEYVWEDDEQCDDLDNCDVVDFSQMDSGQSSSDFDNVAVITPKDQLSGGTTSSELSHAVARSVHVHDHTYCFTRDKEDSILDHVDVRVTLEHSYSVVSSTEQFISAICNCSRRRMQEADELLGNNNVKAKSSKCIHYESCPKNRSTVFKCETCGETFSKNRHLKSHSLRVHPHEERLQCQTCGKTFRKECHLRAHSFVHMSRKVFACQNCDQAFAHPTALRRHISCHSERAFKCEVCDKSFKTEFVLKKHAIRHSPKSFKCEVCGKCFRSSEVLRKHSALHTKRYKCDKCDKAFGARRYLKKHSIVHVEHRPFKCGQCDKAFKTAYQLRQHSAVHEEYTQNILICDTCGKMYTRSSRSHFNAHLRTHTRTPTVDK